MANCDETATIAAITTRTLRRLADRGSHCSGSRAHQVVTKPSSRHRVLTARSSGWSTPRAQSTFTTGFACSFGDTSSTQPYRSSRVLRLGANLCQHNSLELRAWADTMISWTKRALLWRARVTLSTLILFGALLGVGSAPVEAASPQYSAVFQDTNGCRVFEFVKQAGNATWQDAQSETRARSYQGSTGRLVTVDSQAASDAVVAAFGDEIAANGPWIGAYSPTGSNNAASGWLWDSGRPFVFSNFIPGEPSGWTGEPLRGRPNVRRNLGRRLELERRTCSTIYQRTASSQNTTWPAR